VKSLQARDGDIEPVLGWVRAGCRPSAQNVANESPATRHYWILWDSLFLQDGLLYRNFHSKDGVDVHCQLITPIALRKEILYQVHDSVLSGHLGTKKTLHKAKQKFYWYEMKQDINIYIQQCDICAANKEPSKKPRAPLGSMPTGAPLDRIATDILGPLPLTERNNRYVLVVADYFTKWVELFAIPDQTAETCAHKICSEVVCRLGSPLQLHSDQGRNYESDLFKQMCNLLEIRKTRTSPRNPKGNGMLERMMRTVVRMVRAYLRGEQRDWDMHLSYLASAYRATPNESTRFSPNMLMFGREVRLPVEVMLGSHGSQGGPISSYGDYVAKLKTKMQKAHLVCRKHLEISAKRQKAYYDTKQSFYKYKPGDAIWYLNEKRIEGICPKLQLAYDGPWIVVDRINDLDYRVQKGK